MLCCQKLSQLLDLYRMAQIYLCLCLLIYHLIRDEIEILYTKQAIDVKPQKFKQGEINDLVRD